MTDQTPESEPQDRVDEREERREARRAARGARSRSGTWIGGAVLIVLGIVFLLQNLGSTSFFLNNWWALFILIPAIGAFERGMRMYREAGNQFTRGARSALFSGLIMLLVTVVFLFNLDLSLLGPAILILIGVSLLANSMLADK